MQVEVIQTVDQYDEIKECKNECINQRVILYRIVV